MRFGFVLAVNITFAIVADLELPRMASAQTSVGFTNPKDIGPLLDYRLPDWGYRTIKVQLGLMGNGQKLSGPACAYCPEATGASASEALNLQWYRESEQRVWSLGAIQEGSWNWRQTELEPEDRIGSNLAGLVSVGSFSRNYIARDFFLVGTASVNTAYEESRANQGSNHHLSLDRRFSGSIGLGPGWGRMRDVTPVLQAQRISERLQALGRPPLAQEVVLRLASVLAQRGGYFQVFDRPDRQLWRDVLEPLIANGETLAPYEVYYLGDVFSEALGSRQEGFLVDLRGQVQRSTQEDGTHYGATDWGPSVGVDWSHNLNLDHEISASVNSLYFWSDRDGGSEDERGLASLTLQHLWVLADRLWWINRARGSLIYSEFNAPATQSLISREQNADLQSALSFYVEDRVSMGPWGELRWERFESGGAWREDLTWRLQFNITYDLQNLLY